MPGEVEKKHKRKKGRPTDEQDSAKPPDAVPDAETKPSKKKRKKTATSSKFEEAVARVINPDDQERDMKKKKKKKSKTEAACSIPPEQAVLADAKESPSGRPEEAQDNIARGFNNKAEAEEIRARLGISAADPKSAQKKKSFQFSFSIPQPPEPEIDAAIEEQKAVQADVEQSGGAEPVLEENSTPQPARGNPTPEKHPTESMADDFVPRRVYVGGMPFWYTEEQIRECWGECGEIQSLTMLTFPDSGNFRGIVFITFVSQDAYEAALEFNGDELEGKYLVVKPCRAAVSRQVEAAPSKAADGGLSAARISMAGSSKRAVGKPEIKTGPQKARKSFEKAPERVRDYNVLFVGNVPWELTRSSVSDLFREFKPKFVRMFDKPGTRQHKGFAHIHFGDEASVDKALSMNGASIMGRKLVVMYAQPSREVKQKPKQDLIEDGM